MASWVLVLILATLSAVVSLREVAALLAMDE